MSQVMKIAPHDYNGHRLATEVILEWSDEDAFTLQLTVEDAKPREGEGFELIVDHGMCGLTMAGQVSYMAAVVMTPDEAKQLHDALGKVLAE